jgi:hypothetical protein
VTLSILEAGRNRETPYWLSREEWFPGRLDENLVGIDLASPQEGWQMTYHPPASMNPDPARNGSEEPGGERSVLMRSPDEELSLAIHPQEGIVWTYRAREEEGWSVTRCRLNRPTGP